LQNTIVTVGLTLLTAVGGWIVREYQATVKTQNKHMSDLDDAVKLVENRALVIETKADISGPTLDEVRARQQADGIRLAANEIALATIKESIQNINKNQSEIMAKLDEVPKLTVALQNFSDICKTVVPRQEIEARFEDFNRRLEK
jgi:hypothetical protein